MPDLLLEINGLNAYYNDFQVLWDIDLKVYSGEIVTVIGPNGSGKSSLMGAVMGMVQSRDALEPMVTYKGKILDTLKPEDVVRCGISFVPEGARVFPEMSCRDNLKLGAHLLKNQEREIQLMTGVIDLFPILKDRMHQTAKTLSGGERQMLAIGRALMADPQFLLLDEPSLGLHPKMVSRIFNNIERINSQGLTILMVEQKVSFALKMSHRAYVLENGRIVMTGPGEELLGNEHVRKVYLSV